jgi:hypothetical protein
MAPAAFAAKPGKHKTAAKLPAAEERPIIPPVPPVPVAAPAAVIKGKIFTMDHPETEAFRYENTRTQEGSTLFSRTIYTDLAGKHLVDEETIYDSGKFSKYTYTQLQTGDSGFIEVKDGKVFFSFSDPEKTKADDKSYNADMITADMLQDKIHQNWDLLMKGDDLKTRFLVLEVQDDFGFKIFKDGETNFNGRPAVSLTMKASGFFVALAAPSFHFIVEKEAPHRLLRMEGRLPVRIPKRIPVETRKDLKAMDGILALEYPSAAPQSSEGASSPAGKLPPASGKSGAEAPASGR